MLPDLTQPEIDTLRDAITGERMRNRITRYAPDDRSRHVAHSGNRHATEVLFADMDRIGAPLIAAQRPFSFRDGTLYNVEAVLRHHERPGLVIVSAHLDSTAIDVGFEPMVDPAPGADDDASGVAGVVLAARALVALARALPEMPRREIRFVLFNAEEVGQIGSRAYVEDLRASRLHVLGAYQMDMIGYAAVGQRPFEIHVGYPDAQYVQDASIQLASIIQRVCPVVSPALTPQVVLTHRDSSDHSSFHSESYPACLVSEDHTDTAGIPANPNPAWHRQSDTHDKLHFEYAADIARAVAAAAWYQATR